MVELDDVPRKMLVDGIKAVLTRLQDEGLLPHKKSYRDVLGEPKTLYEFIETFRRNKHIASDLLVDLKGNIVSEDDKELRCGVTLEQVCQMLVFTCARRVMPGKVNESKLVALSGYLAYSWQLPLLQAYDLLFSTEQIDVLGEDLLDLRSKEKLEVVASFRVDDISRAKFMTGDRFVEMISENPAAVGGVVSCNEEDYKFLEEILGDRIWQFFARDPYYVKMILSLDKRLSQAFGPALAGLVEDAFHRIRRMPVEKSVILIQSFTGKYGKYADALLSSPEFLNSLFKNMVEYLYLLEGDEELFRETVRIKLNALHEDIVMWAKKVSSGS
jgi:hypothetical protein